MSTEQTKALLMIYVGRVVDLRVAGQRDQRERMKMAAEFAEKEQTIVSLQRSLKQAQLETDRKLLTQEKVLSIETQHFKIYEYSYPVRVSTYSHYTCPYTGAPAEVRGVSGAVNHS